jgi:hypothetical protein
MTKREILDRIESLCCSIKEIDKEYFETVIKNKTENLTRNNECLEEQNKRLINIIETLVEDKFTTKDFEAVMIKPYREKPILIKDGKRIDNENMTSFDIDWGCDRKIEINVRNE